MVGGFHGMLLLLSAKRPRSLVWWEDTLWKAIRNALWRNSNTVWSNITQFVRKTCRDCIQFGPKVLPGTFLGYALYAGGIWKGDIMVADIEELEEMDASVLHARRLNAKEVLTPTKFEKFMFPVADGTVKISGEDQDLRTFTLTRSVRNEEKSKIIFENQKGLLQPHDKTHQGMMVKPKVIFGLSEEILFTVITWNPESNCTCRLKNHSLFHWNTLTLPELPIPM